LNVLAAAEPIPTNGFHSADPILISTRDGFSSFVSVAFLTSFAIVTKFSIVSHADFIFNHRSSAHCKSQYISKNDGDFLDTGFLRMSLATISPQSPVPDIKNE
jgi:hypothetical protein